MLQLEYNQKMILDYQRAIVKNKLQINDTDSRRGMKRNKEQTKEFQMSNNEKTILYAEDIE